MRFADVVVVALAQLRTNKLRSFFTLLGIIVSVGFLVAVVAIIQGMNAYVSENLASALIGQNTFQVRRLPIQIGLFDDEEMRRMARRPRVSERDAVAVAAAVPEAVAVSRQSGWPTPQADVFWSDRRLGDVLIFGVTADYQVVQDYSFSRGSPMTDLDVDERRPVAVIGAEIAEKLFEDVDPVGQEIRILGRRFLVQGVVAKKGRVLGQSFDGFVIIPLTLFETMYGRRLNTTVSVKLPSPDLVASAMQRAEEAMRVSHGLRPRDDNDFTIEASDALIEFWRRLTGVLFAAIPAMVAIGIVIGGIVIMNIMLMAVRERTREIGIRKSVGARAVDIRRQFLAEAVALTTVGGILGVLGGTALAMLVALLTPLPARVTAWSVMLSLFLGASVGILFGVYPASRASRLDPITALRAE
ncbi:MAG TPA: ABC transporter permease [Gemmatimonadaceae bacterium]|nr:ABC transporter permease [Gemmatimonadaceae bacterium]